ncbi:MAG: chromosome segregation protein SMC [Clostridia bacterium]|nr:chromosome segregation protein SMC [Clostridia bacterium]
MNFKGMQLVGFKSFADKTTITFDDGVTCIVGPNGCGKSNVADAVRWVLGEQSAKTMRGSSMQDVIFSGTEKRKSLSFCEVTLTFDNTSRIFDVEYDEVAMTRRLFRNGESEYLLNKQNCRLKDIVALLHGVGIGKEGYSIIGQGKVEQIMNAKPEDRRAIFEEATGIMMFKGRKAEVERKLENSADNLNLFLQRMSEVEKQVGPLSRQSETARKYNEYYAELKKTECNVYLYRSDNAAGEKAVIQAEIDKINLKIDELNAEIETLNQNTEENRMKIANADRDLSEQNAKLLSLTVGLERKSGEAQRVKDRAGFFRDQLQTANDRIGYCMRRIEAIDKELKNGEKNAATGTKRLESTKKEIEKLTERLYELSAQITEYEKRSDETSRDVLSRAENLSALKENKGSLSAKREATEERLSEVESTLKRLQERRSAIERDCETATKEEMRLRSVLDEEQSAFAGVYEKQDALTEKSNRIHQELFGCNAQIASLRENLNFYIGLKNRFDGYKYSVKKLMSEAKNNPSLSAKLKGMIADIVSTDAKYEVAIETAFGGAMQNVVTAKADDARQLIEYLKRSGGGVVTFLPVDSMKPHYASAECKRAISETGALGLATDLVSYDPYYDSVIQNLLGNTLVCDTIANATQIARKYRSAFRIVTLDGDIVSTSGAMTGGSRKQESGNLLANERKIKECEDTIEEKKGYLLKLEQMERHIRFQKEEADKQAEELRETFQSAKSDLAALMQKQEALAVSLAECNESVREYDEVLRSLKARASELSSEFSLSAEDEEALSALKEKAAKDMEAQREQYSAVRIEFDEKNAKLGELKVELAALTGTLETEETNRKRLESERESLLSEMTETRKNVANIEVTIKNLDQEAERKALTPEERAQVDGLRAGIAALGEEKKLLNARNVLMENRKSELLSEISKLQDRKFQCDLNSNKIDAALENTRQRMEEEYGLDYEGCLAFKDESFDMRGSATLVNSLKHKIGALGAVNPNAIEEYEQVKARYEEMQVQQADLEKGISDLKTVLETLKAEMQKQFDDGFKKINENFKTTYKELFGGGRAELQMEYEDGVDPLDAGVEIMACPPGKKLTKISLLSGGERALTAIAILFAILKLRPMPFCILDEIEAALDEANVDRFAQYLKNFSKDTQFIVITHRKPTMEQADSLFGVTMEEKGVSKIVSVKLSELEERLGGDTVA